MKSGDDDCFVKMCRKRIARAREEIKLYSFLRRVEPHIRRLPERPSPIAVFRLLNNISSYSFNEARQRLREYLASWNENEIPEQLRKMLK